jgi:hypothetical protein
LVNITNKTNFKIDYRSKAENSGEKKRKEKKRKEKKRKEKKRKKRKEKKRKEKKRKEKKRTYVLPAFLCSVAVIKL